MAIRVCVAGVTGWTGRAIADAVDAADDPRYLDAGEVIDYASATKQDAPSGTSREVAERLAGVRAPAAPVSVEDVHGAPEARGATVAGTQVHSLRLPSFVVSTEVVFAADGERLSLRHDGARRRRRTSPGRCLRSVQCLGASALRAASISC